MNYKDLKIMHSYISRGNNNIADSFLNPVLKLTKEYKRSVGFFSSGVLNTVMDGIVSLARNGGTMKLIASPKLNEEDVEAINLGYKQRQNLVENAFTRDFVDEIEKLDDVRLQMLCDLISSGTLDIKIAITCDTGIYHDKLGILKDFQGNQIAFYGSSNSSYGGYRSNYEKIRVSKSWDPGFSIIVQEEDKEFDSLWNNTNEFVEVYEYSETAEKELIEVIGRKRNSGEKEVIKLRDYQEQAIAAWVKNNYHGFYVMATGTGKTWTAIYSAKELVKKYPSIIAICAPYKHLVKQWSEDVQSAFPKAKIIMVSSENQGWDKQITNEIIRSKYDAETQLIIISTIASFSTKRFINAVLKYEGNRLLIVDEAHRFTKRPEVLHKIFNFMLGLSATPFSGTSAVKGNELMHFFGGQVFSLPIEEALERGYLVPYYYYPIYVYATDEEEDKFNKYTRIILSCFKNGKCVDPDTLVKMLRNRLRIISMSEEKQSKIDEIISYVEEEDHFVVYCGDGKLFDYDRGEEIRHIQSVKKILSEHEYKASQFTAKENMQERMQLVDSFNKGEISALAAIRCLDEGINIPSIKSALILSSNDDYREFVQRRGRILRTYGDKKYAKIYDVIVLPKSSSTSWANIELRRFHEYAKLALNWNESLESELTDLLFQYGLSIDDVDVYDYEEMEDYDDD
ncbi:MAG: DEAD/DEAH box helicase family protein [Clostridium sp.]|uniref:DEAD/DEAH box helicase family protein n=1 Tax=Faecalicoccus sp. TaxID=1971758 RepID=UPI002A83F0C4|nr:DEAD/DEAH box helicase family protein [Faecalicoccus sp.]MCI6691484.1 DEAD/DEAH box helicase family protein [Clostridium sp.]MCI7179830.1 DEAD/DEAH box helicase family protein [Lachnospiraceae bacterium]MDY4501650.1 DEAD/DEAH box helicase family protein [Lactobacillus johnsonii]MDY4670434.1 DEAD/DEAH box helicase family protein [Oliverpabstia sp.]MDY4279412.1 DEAD/DEAH box helicase family protein [Faecalicoccus sp.]